MKTYLKDNNGRDTPTLTANFPCRHENLSRANWGYAPGEPYATILCLDCEHHVQLHASEFPDWLKRDAPKLAELARAEGFDCEPPDMKGAVS